MFHACIFHSSTDLGAKPVFFVPYKVYSVRLQFHKAFHTALETYYAKFTFICCLMCAQCVNNVTCLH